MHNDLTILLTIVASTRCHCWCNSWNSDCTSKYGLRENCKLGSPIWFIVCSTTYWDIYDLYHYFNSTSFVGVTLYCFFGTSKDISIGPICKTNS